MPFKNWTMAQIKQANRESGYHFFDRSTMRFFDSKVESTTPCVGTAAVCFVTSEQFHGSDGRSEPRRYTVRKFNPETHDIDTVGAFNAIRDRAEALRLAWRTAKGIE